VVTFKCSSAISVNKGEEMKKSMKISGLVWALLLASGAASAAGLGKLTVQSALGQPLRAEIELLSVSKEELADISARIASPDAYKQARIDRVEALSNLRFAVDQRANGQPVIRITSSTGVADPFLDLLIELNWSSGRVIREYTILLDPVADAKPAEAVKPMAIPEAGRNGEPRQAASAEAQKAKTPAPAPAPAAAGPRRYGPVKSGETLRAIAGKVKPAEVSLEQMMVGLYQANKGAFSNDNMNWLKRGQVLNVPEPGKVMATAPREAARTVQGPCRRMACLSQETGRNGGGGAPGGRKTRRRQDHAQGRGKGRARAGRAQGCAQAVQGGAGNRRRQGGREDPGTTADPGGGGGGQEPCLAGSPGSRRPARTHRPRYAETPGTQGPGGGQGAGARAGAKPWFRRNRPRSRRPPRRRSRPRPSPSNSPRRLPRLCRPRPIPSSSWISTFISNPLYIGGWSPPCCCRRCSG
jgi:FimV-like protein